MQKSLRLAAVAAVLSLTAATSLHAEQTGTNPHPQITSLVASVRAFFGL